MQLHVKSPLGFENNNFRSMSISWDLTVYCSNGRIYSGSSTPDPFHSDDRRVCTSIRTPGQLICFTCHGLVKTVSRTWQGVDAVVTYTSLSMCQNPSVPTTNQPVRSALIN